MPVYGNIISQALAVVTIGKMFLQHEDQAKRIIPALGKMLESTKHSSIKINIVFTLSDMCVRWVCETVYLEKNDIPLIFLMEGELWIMC